MRNRCNNPRYSKYYLHGGRGIRVCPQWDNFNQFVKDMGPRPEGTTLDRKDGDKNYDKDNCRWATVEEQNDWRRKRIQIRNKTGITGVRWNRDWGRWYAYAQIDGKCVNLYSGKDFFEACCTRKSWEAVNV